MITTIKFNGQSEEFVDLGPGVVVQKVEAIFRKKPNGKWVLEPPLEKVLNYPRTSKKMVFFVSK